MQVLVDLTEKGAAEVVFHPNKHRRGQGSANPRTLPARGQAGHYASERFRMLQNASKCFKMI